MKMNTHLLSHLAQVFLEWEMFQTNFVEKIKTYILFCITFSKMPPFWENVKKNYCRTVKNTDYKMASAHFMLDT